MLLGKGSQPLPGDQRRQLICHVTEPIEEKRKHVSSPGKSSKNKSQSLCWSRSNIDKNIQYREWKGSVRN